MIKRQTLLDFIQSSEHKPSESLKAKIDALPVSFTLQQLGEAMLKDEDGAMSEGALLAMAFAQHLLEKKDPSMATAQPAAKPAAPKSTSTSRGSVGCSHFDQIRAGGFPADQAVVFGRF